MEHTEINGYTLQYILGDGGMAEVWYAQNILQQPAAIKILKPQFLQVPEVLARFENEAQLMVQLKHPHIRAIHGYGQIDGRPAMVMEYLEGNDVAKLLKKNHPFYPEQLIAWWNDLVDALQYMHRKHIVHCDIKPSNIFVTEAGQVKLTDFGVACDTNNMQEGLVSSRSGTLVYMSPEQLYDAKAVSEKSDAYSLAITFYEWVTGHAPYDKNLLSDFEIQERITRRPLDMQHLAQPWNNLLPDYLYKRPEERKALRRIELNKTVYDHDTLVFAPEPPKPLVQPVTMAMPEKKKSGSWFWTIFVLVFLAGLILFVVNEAAIMPYIRNFFKQENTTEAPPATNRRTTPRRNTPAPNTNITVTDTPETTEAQQITSVDLEQREGHIRNLMGDYYKSRSDCSALYRFFSDTIKQYYTKSDLQLKDAIKECENYNNKWQYIDAQVTPGSYIFKHQANGNSFVDFNMLYKIKQKEDDLWIPYNIDVSALISPDNKIIRIVEKRIEKL